MSKRWTMEDDQFVVEYFEAVGDFIGPHDLGRPAGSVTRRVKHLKECGAWDALKAVRYYEWAYRVSANQMRDGDQDYPEGYGAPAEFPHPSLSIRLVHGGDKE